MTALSTPVQGCRAHPLGALRYRATASPDFVARFMPNGMTPDALAGAPALTFNEKDGLQARWICAVLGRPVACPTHWLPSTHGFVDACLAGMGWGMNPEALVGEHIAARRLVELAPDAPLDIALSWQVNRLAAAALDGLTRDVVAAARTALVQPSLQP